MALLSPGRGSIPAVPGSEGWVTISVYAGGSVERGILYLGLFYLLWALSQSGSRAPYRILAVAGIAHAGLAVILLVTGGTSKTSVLWVYVLKEVLTPFGTYVNKNHFAGLMLITGGAALAVSDADILATQQRIAAEQGLLMCPEGAATHVGWRQALAAGLVGDDDEVVLFNCATGLKYPMPDHSRPFIRIADL